MIVERSGSLFDSECSALAQGVNTMGSMGAGIAVEFRKRWPAMYEEYREWCASGRLQPGSIHVFEAADRTIINMATQRAFRRGSARLEWVRAAARETALLPLEGLALPRIGAGLGGLPWDAVRRVLEEELTPLAYVEIWSLPESR